MKILPSVLFLLLISSAIAGGNSIPAVPVPDGLRGEASPRRSDVLRVYTSIGSLQCQGGGVSLTTLQFRLEKAGIRVTAATYGNDGLMRIAVCGASDGKIGIFDISPTQAETARSLGFLPLSELSDGQTSN